MSKGKSFHTHASVTRHPTAESLMEETNRLLVVED